MVGLLHVGILLSCIITYATALVYYNPVFQYAGKGTVWIFVNSTVTSIALPNGPLPTFFVFNASAKALRYVPSSNADVEIGTYQCVLSFSDSTNAVLPVTIGPVKRLVDHSFDASLCGQGNFYDQREQLERKDREDVDQVNKDRVGELSAKEKIVDAYLHLLKNEHFEHTYGHFPPAHSFMDALTRQFIDTSTVLEQLTLMPKGGNLHIHMFGSAEARWMARQMLQMPGLSLFVNRQNPNAPVLDFSPLPTLAGFDRLSLLDETYVRNLISWQPLSLDEYPRLAEVLNWESLDAWKDFQAKFAIFKSPVRYDKFFQLYVKKVLTDAAKENVLYMEIRHEPGKVFVFNVTGGKEVMSAQAELSLINQIIAEVKQEYPSFHGARIIWPTQRGLDDDAILSAIDAAISTSQDPRFTDLIAGFDLIGEEDRGFTLLHHSKIIQDKRQNMTDNGLSYMFHAGETNWASDINGSPNQDVSPDENLFDAILDGSVRLGHAFALFKHPKLMEIVKEKDIGLEIAPISNQLLRYAEDIRDHPAVEYLNLGLPVVLCSDDPGIFGYQNLTHDYYQAFMSWGLTLIDLKVLSSNGIRYSSLSNQTKVNLINNQWTTAWNQWIDTMYTAASLYPLPETLEFYNVYCGKQTGGDEVVYDVNNATFSFNLTMDVSCTFGDKEGPGVVWSATQVKCFTPSVPSAQDVYNVSVTVNGHDFVVDDSFFKFYTYDSVKTAASALTSATTSASSIASTTALTTASSLTAVSSATTATSALSAATSTGAASGAASGAAAAVTTLSATVTSTSTSSAAPAKINNSSASSLDAGWIVLLHVVMLCIFVA